MPSKQRYICGLEAVPTNGQFERLNAQNVMVKRIQDFFEQNAFGVCTRLGEKLGMSISAIRLFFIYASFLTFGSPVIVYLALAFIMNFRKHLRRRHHTIWDF